MFEEEGEEQLKKAGELMSEFVNQTAKLEVVKIVRDNIMATEQYWKFRKNMLMSGGILVESTTEVIDTGDIIELRITCRVPPEAAENYAKRRLLFKRLCRMLEERGKEFLMKAFATSKDAGLMRKNYWGASEEEV